MIQVDTLKLFRLWRSDLANDALADALGVPRGSLWYLRRRFKLPERGKAKRVRCTKERIAPTPDEISERCAEIRSRWTAAEEESRRVGPRSERWVLPSYVYDGRGCAFLEVALD